MGVLRLSFLSSFVLELFASLSVAIVAGRSGCASSAEASTVEVALIVLLLAPEAFPPLRTLGASYHAAAEGRSVTSKILDILDDPGRPPGTRTVYGALDVVAVQDVSVQRVDTTAARWLRFPSGCTRVASSRWSAPPAAASPRC